MTRTSQPRTSTPPTRRRAARRRSSIVRAVALVLVAAAWLAISSVGGPLVGRLSQVQQNDQASFLPDSAESTQFAHLAKKFQGPAAIPFFVVVSSDAAITPDDQAAVQRYAQRLTDLRLTVDPKEAAGRTFRLGDYLTAQPRVAIPSKDGRARLLPVVLDASRTGEALPDGESVLQRSAEALRAAAAQDLGQNGLDVYVAGPAGLVADLVTAFSGIDGRLLGVSLIAVFVILLLVYRSPLLPLVALGTAAFGLSLAALVVYPLAKHDVITLDGQSQGILSILVIGAATDYALLLVARYREELHDNESRFVAMSRAWWGSVEAIVASAATVVLGLLCLLLSQLGSTRGLGPIGAIGIAGALLAALTLLPLLLLFPVVLLVLLAVGVALGIGAAVGVGVVGAVLAVAVLGTAGYFGWRRWKVLGATSKAPSSTRRARLPWYARAVAGRWLFWPRTPAVDHIRRKDALRRNGIWARVARLVGEHPRAVWAGTLTVLIAAATFAPTFAAAGVSQEQVFRTTVESVTGQRVLAQHFPAGSGSPVLLVVQETDATRALRVVSAVPGVASARISPDVSMEVAAPTSPTAPAAQPGRNPRPPVPAMVVDGQVQIEATLVPAADSAAGQDVVQRLRSAVDVVGQDVLVGGPTATDLDVRAATRRDLAVVVPAVLVVIALVLMLLLRSVLAPLLLIAANLVSFGATLGISSLVFDHVLDFPGADPAVPLYGFVFLVALGIDYSIFLMTRVREESRHATRPGVLAGLTVTGGVITSAGVVLAATFGTLGTIPILFLQQIAFIVAFGVLLDTLVVRSLLVPALAYDLGSRVWWPGSLRDRPSDLAPPSAKAEV